jgi:hypothetical protein
VFRGQCRWAFREGVSKPCDNVIESAACERNNRILWISIKCFNLTPPKFPNCFKFLRKMQTREKIFPKKALLLDRVLSHAFKLFV